MKITNCRMCGSSNLYKYLDLGHTPLADRFLTDLQLEEDETYYPLCVTLCENCGLHQLNYVVDPTILYQKDYPYDMSTTQTGGIHWTNFATDTVKRFSLNNKDLVIDIGSNSGVLLQKFKDNGTRVLGVDPATNIALLANSKGIETIADFFNLKTAKHIVKEYGRASIITGTNVFAHIHDLHEILNGVKTLLNKDGVFIIESPHLLNLINNLEYDTIYHEHLSYLSIKPIAKFVEGFGLEIIDVIETSIHGGSIRVMISHKGSHKKTRIASKLIKQENKAGLYSKEKLDDFAKNVYKHKLQLVEMLYKIKKSGKKICAVSGPAKGMTLLNYCQISSDLIDFLSEKNPLKIGRYTPGAHIPIVSDEDMVKLKPDYALLLAWNFSEEIMKNLADFKKQGGKFIIPIPKPIIK